MTVATKDWWNKCELRTYEDYLKYFMTARTKDKGKPLRSWARIFLVGDTLEFRFADFKFGELTPDNIFTFVATPHAVRSNAAVTFASSLYKAIPIMWQRVGTARYRVCHTSQVPTSSSYNEYYNTQQTSMEWAYMRTSAPEYFAGIQFNMLTGECINRQADLTSNINTDTRKVWLNSLRKFKYGIKARLRIGAFDAIIETVKQLPKNQQQVPEWSDPRWIDLLYQSIRDNNHPMELLQGFSSHAVYDRWYYHRGNIKPADILAVVDSICTTHSIDLRKRFGVFDEEPKT